MNCNTSPQTGTAPPRSASLQTGPAPRRNAGLQAPTGRTGQHRPRSGAKLPSPLPLPAPRPPRQAKSSETHPPLAALLLTAPLTAAAQPVRVTLVNGTTGDVASPDLVTLYRLGQGMEPVDSVENPTGEARLEAPEDDAGAGPAGMRPFLLQATYRGVNYNAPVRLTPGETTEAAIVVYDPFEEWNDSEIGLSTWRALYRRMPGDRSTLRVDHIFVVDNRTEPARTFTRDDETLRFRLPPEGALLELPTISSTGETGMPVPQSSFAVGDEGDYAIRTAFKPGETEIVLSYAVAYEDERYEAALVAPRASPEVLLLASPPDMRLEIPAGAPPGWEILGPDEEARLTAARKFDIAAGEAVGLIFSGGTPPPPAAPTIPGGRQLPGLVAQPEGGGSAVGTIGLLPDPSRPSKWALVLLMAAALGFGLLHRAFGGGASD